MGHLPFSRSPLGESLIQRAKLDPAQDPGHFMTLIANAPAEERLDQPGIDERRALLDRVASSAQFRRSARLRDFLLYVGGQSLKDGCPEIHEQEIGAKVFGRSASYDRSQDNIVRVNATELRKRIEQYFATEGSNETLVLEIPRGGYKPVFHRRVPGIPSESAPTTAANRPLPLAPSESTPASHRTGANPGRRLWSILCVGLAATSILLFQQNRALRKALNPWAGKPTVAAFWDDFLSYHQQTDVVLPDDSLMVTEDLFGHSVSLEDYLSRNYMRQIQSSNLSNDRKSDLDQIFSHNLVTFGGVEAAQLMLAQIPASSPSNLTLARYYVADSIKRDNVILVGGKKANPWVHLFTDQMNFVTDFDDVHGQAFVANRNPKPGEQAAYLVSHDANALVGYTTIAYLPNLSHTGNVIILAGTDSDATSAAADFLTSEDHLSKFKATLGLNKLPYFEALLKTSRLSGTSFSEQLVAYRTYPERH